MKIIDIKHLLLTLGLLFGAIQGAFAADRFYMDAVNIEPGETRTLAFYLENEKPYFGFQADLNLPEGLEVVAENGKPSITLSSRADNSFRIVSNTLADGTLRFGTFSASHVSFTGDSGALLYIKVKATSEFSGGELTVKDILFVGTGDKDIEFPDISMSLGTRHNDTAYIPDFRIAVGEAKQISLRLSNETSFTAFQADIVLPVGLTIRDGSFKPGPRAADHTISAKSFSDGRTRIACLSLSNTPFSGNSGALVEFTVVADKDIAETTEMQLRNVIFTKPDAREYALPNSVVNITTERAQVESITLSPTELIMTADGSISVIQATVLPTFASTKDLEWTTDAPDIAAVSQAGAVTAIAPGTALITASATDGSGVTATCTVTVHGVPVTSVVLNRATASLKVDDTVSLSATVLPANAWDKSISWSSSDETIATVDENGTVTAVALGSATIKATSCSNPEAFGECKVTVVPTPVTDITLSHSAVALKVGETVKIEAAVSPAAATNKAIVWESRNPEIASVDEDGLVSALALGSTNLTATAADGSGATATCAVNVILTPAESITINTPDRTSFKVGEVIQLSATVLPENASDKTVTWYSDNTSVATVDENGSVTAQSVGTAVISAKSGTKEAAVSLTVVPTPAEAISLDRVTASLNVNRTIRLSVSFTPATTTNKSVTWTSSDDAVATVDSDGVVTAKALGECVITATTSDGSNKTASCTITVEAIPAESIIIEPYGTSTLHVGETIRFNATVLPEDASDKSISWSSSDETIATVDENGTVTAVALGSATIKATSCSNPEAFGECTVTVVPTPVTHITLSHSAVALKVGETVKIKAAVSPASATNKAIVWESRNPEIASVDEDGLVSALALGSTNLTATAADGSGTTAMCAVNVILTPAESITINTPDRTSFKVGEVIQLSATVLPENASDKTVIWYSDNTSVATVDENGAVTAQSVGTAVISAKSGTKEAAVSLTVVPTQAEAISLDRVTASLNVNRTIQLSISFTPATTTDKSVTWTSSDDAVATVDSDGLVTAKAFGECVITATTSDGSNKTASCTITVEATPASGIIIEPSGSLTLNVGETIRFHATVLPEDATDKSVTWLSESSAVKIDSDGLATAMAPVENNRILATNSYGQRDVVYVTVVGDSVLWSQQFENKPSDRVELTAGLENASDISYRCVRPNGGFVEAEIENINGKWYATFPEEGAYILEAYVTEFPSIKSRKVFNVVNPDDLMHIDGIYYRYADSNKNTLKVVRGHKMYSGDYTIPSSVNGMKVMAVDDKAFYSCTELGKVVISEGIKTIGEQSFGNGTLSAIVIPASVNRISLFAFNALYKTDGHYSLMSISLCGKTPVSVDPLIFNGYINYDLCELHVPEGTSSLYASAEVWKEFTKIIDDLPAPIDVESVEILQGDEASVIIGQTLQLTAKVSPDDAADKTIEWTSEDSRVATVTADSGLIYGVNVGQTKVYATSTNGRQDVITVNVLPIEAENIEIILPATELTVGESLKAQARISPENTTDKSVEWAVSEPSVISVDRSGVVTAHSPGKAYLFAETVNGLSCSVLLTVKPILIQSITIPSDVIVESGTQYKFTPEVFPDNASVKSLVWESSNPDLGSFFGNVFHAYARGEVTATCRAADGSDVSAQCHIKIETHARSLTLNEHDLNLETDDTFRLVATIEPIDAVDSGPVIWESSNTAAVAVDMNGLITALSEGESVVTAQTQYYPWATDECNIKVSRHSGIETISIDDAVVHVDGKTITVDGLTQGATVSLTDLDGQVKSFIYDGHPLQIRAGRSGTYILSLGKHSLKIAVF